MEPSHQLSHNRSRRFSISSSGGNNRSFYPPRMLKFLRLTFRYMPYREQLAECVRICKWQLRDRRQSPKLRSTRSTISGEIDEWKGPMTEITIGHHIGKMMGESWTQSPRITSLDEIIIGLEMGCELLIKTKYVVKVNLVSAKKTTNYSALLFSQYGQISSNCDKGP